MTLPHSPARTQQELVLQTLFGPALAATKGLAAPETGHAYAQAHELCQQVGKTARLFPVLWGLWMFYYVRAQHETALELGQQFFALAQHQQASDLLAPAYRMLGTTSFCLGELRLAHSYLDQGRALYDPHQHQSLVFLYGFDIGVGVSLSRPGPCGCWAILSVLCRASTSAHLSAKALSPLQPGSCPGLGYPAPSVSPGEPRAPRTGRGNEYALD